MKNKPFQVEKIHSFMPQVIRKSLTNSRYLIIFNNVDKNNGLVVFRAKRVWRMAGRLGEERMSKPNTFHRRLPIETTALRWMRTMAAATEYE